MRPRVLAIVVAALLCPVGCGDDANPAGTAADPRVDVILDASPDPLGAERVDEAFLAITAVEILPCVDAGATLRGHLRRSFGVRTALAHGATTPTRLGVPALDDLGPTAAALTVGTLAPPVVSYCRVRITFGPADGDAKRMPESRSALGRTLWFRGRAGGADVTLTTTEARTVDRVVPAFVPGAGGRRTFLHLARAAGKPLADLDTNPEHIASASVSVLERLVEATTARTE